MTSAHNGVEAWARLETERVPILVILAWRMEGMLGIDVCRRLRLHPELPTAYVLLLVDHRGEEDLLDGVNGGADDFLLAPLDPVETRARIRTGARIIETELSLKATQDALRVQSTRDGDHRLVEPRLDPRPAPEGTGARAAQERFGRASSSRTSTSSAKSTKASGIAVGDEVLREAARRLNSSARPYDAVGRYGGEEFLIVLPGSDGLGGLTVAERIREGFANRPVLTTAGPVPITLSLGVAAEGGEAGGDGSALSCSRPTRRSPGRRRAGATASRWPTIRACRSTPSRTPEGRQSRWTRAGTDCPRRATPTSRKESGSATARRVSSAPGLR